MTCPNCERLRTALERIRDIHAFGGMYGLIALDTCIDIAAEVLASLPSGQGSATIREEQREAAARALPSFPSKLPPVTSEGSLIFDRDTEMLWIHTDGEWKYRKMESSEQTPPAPSGEMCGTCRGTKTQMGYTADGRPWAECACPDCNGTGGGRT